MAQLIFESEKDTTRDLCYENGDLVVDLYGEPDRCFLLHGNVVRKASVEFFGAGGKACWDSTAKCFVHPKSQVKHNAPPRPLLDEVRAHGLQGAYGTWMGSGLAMRRDDTHIRDPDETLHHSQLALQTIFKLLYGEAVPAGALCFDDFAEIAAYAALYGLIEVIAPKLRNLLLQIPGLWDDVRAEYLFHLTLGRALRCQETYNDALRHFIGIGHDLSELNENLECSAEETLKIAKLQQKQTRVIGMLTADAQALTLPTYIGSEDYWGEDPSGFEPGIARKSQYHRNPHSPSNVAANEERTDPVARHIFAQWLNQELSGSQPWPYVLENDSGDKDSYTASLLRHACRMATHAKQTGTELDLFDSHAPVAFLHAHLPDNALPDVQYDSSDQIDLLDVEGMLKNLVGQLSTLALPFTAAPDFKPALMSKDDTETQPHRHYPPKNLESGHGRHGGHLSARDRAVHRPSRARQNGEFGVAGTSKGDPAATHFERYGLTAMSEHDTHYFTCLDLSEEGLPWEDGFEKAYEIRGVEPASRAWLKALNLLGPDQ